MAEAEIKEPAAPAAKVSGKVSVGHPVDVATGTLTHDFEDCVLPGRMPLVFGRRYSSAMPDRPDALFGPGWSSPFQMYLRQDLDGYHLLSEDGETVIPFDDPRGLVEAGHTVRNLGMFHELRREGAPNDARREAGYVVTRWNPDTQEVVRFVFHRSPPQQDPRLFHLTSRLSVDGQGIDIHRDPSGRIQSVRQRREGRGFRLVYSNLGATISSATAPSVERLAEVHITAPAHERLVLRYQYDPTGRLCEMTDALGQRCAYEYDDKGRMIREVNLGGMVYHFRFDVRGRCVETTGLDGYGRNTLQIEERARITQVADARDQITLYKWNESGQVEQQISPLGNITTTTYDVEGRIVVKTEPTGATVRYAYDDRGDRVEVVSPTGALTRYEYDEHHRIIGVTDPAGSRWQRRYDDSGRIAAVTNPLGQGLIYSHDVRGDLSEVRDTAGRARHYSWDASGSLTSSTDPLGHRTRYEYDPEGALSAVTDPREHRTELLRDALGHVREVRLPDGARRRFGRDAYGQVAQFIDEIGAVTKRRYAACGLLVEEVRPHGGRIELEWGSIPGQLLAVHNELGERHTFDYDAEGRMTRQVNFAGHATHYEYEKGNKVSAIRDAAGSRTRFERNPSGLVTAVRPASGPPVLYEYDVLGRLTRADNQDCPIEREYDAVGRLLRERQGRHEIISEYDAAGNRCRRKSSLGHETVFEWDENSQLAILWQDDLDPIRFEYDAAGNETSRSIAGGVRITHDYDSRDRRAEQRVQKAGRMGQVRVGGEVLGFRRYNYDAASNLTEILDEKEGATRYQYDPAGRIVSARMPDGFSERFTYDAADNIRRIERAAGAIADENPLPTLQQLDYGRGNVLKSGTSVEYEYNVLGQQIRKRDAAGETRYHWNAQGLLARVQLPSGDEWTYRYDALARRVEKCGPRERTEFIWDGDVVLHEVHIKEDETQPAIHWEFGPYGFAPIGKIDRGQQYLCVNEVNGAPKELRTQNGNTVWKACLTTLGQTRAEISEIDCPIRFQGQWYDSEISLCYNRFRYYEDKVGRFIEEDPTNLAGGLNLFTFTLCPINWTDPYGLSATPCPTNLQKLKDEPSSIWGKSVDEIKEAFESAGYEVKIEPSTKGSMKSTQLRIGGHPTIQNIQVHPGGGRHGGSYYKISTSTEGIVKIADRNTYIPIPGEKATIIYIN